MSGIGAITSQNGWAMALVGTIIVFLGLAILSFAISRLKVLFGWIEKKAGQAVEIGPESTAPDEEDISDEDASLLDIQQAARIYAPLVRGLGQPFALSALYTLTREHDLPHPHLTISAFREAGILASCGEGLFQWEGEV